MKEAEKSIAESKLKSQNNLIGFLEKTIDDFKNISAPNETTLPGASITKPKLQEGSNSIR